MGTFNPVAQPNRKKTLQDVLRERRAGQRLLSPAEVANREASRLRQELELEASEAVARWREGKSVDGRGKLPPAVYRRIFELSSAAYYASGHWSRRARAQLLLAPGCEVAACGATAGAAAHHLTHAALGAEEAGRDLITLCEACHRRVRRLGRDLARVPTREEVAALDPAAPLYDPSSIAALKAKYAKP